MYIFISIILYTAGAFFCMVGYTSGFVYLQRYLKYNAKVNFIGSAASLTLGVVMLFIATGFLAAGLK